MRAFSISSVPSVLSVPSDSVTTSSSSSDLASSDTSDLASSDRSDLQASDSVSSPASDTASSDLVSSDTSTAASSTRASEIKGSLISFKPNKSIINSYFEIGDFNDLSLFTAKIVNTNLSLDNIYTVYVKVRYNIDNFFMVGNQFGFVFSSEKSYKVLFYDITIRLEEYFAYYNLVNEDIVYVQISFRLLDKMIYSDLLINKDKLANITSTEKKDTLDLIVIPTATNEDGLGKCLPVVLDSNNFIKEVNIIIKDRKSNFLDIIIDKTKYIKKNHTDVITAFDKDYKFYYIKGNIHYILVVKQIDQYKVEKLKYSLSGVLLSRIIDTFDGNTLIRCRGLETMYIEDNNVIKVKKLIKFNAIDRYNNKNIKLGWLPNPLIGVIDVETYLNNNNVNAIYALGFRTNLARQPVIYYIDTNHDSNSLVLQMIDELLRPKYSNITFYCHNFGGFDVIFILKVLTTFNERDNENENDKGNKYKISAILRDDKVIKLTIKKNNNTLNILDSYCMLVGSLSRLGKDFGVETQKTTFPYKFSTHDNLFYKGDTPDIHLYNDLSREDYSKIYQQEWSFKDETIKYLKNDLNCLYEIIVSANKQIFRDYKINIKDSLTISGLAMKIYLNKYYNDNIPLINKPSIYKDIKQGYYGGITEVYKPSGENLFYYDVNSLYPYAALNDMPGLTCEKLTYYKYNSDISELFGFFYCRIESPKDLYLGLLPIRVNLGIEFPLGKWEGWYFSEQLKFAKENGYNIEVFKGYNFNREKDVFKSYVDKVYSIKSNPLNPSQKAMAKSLLNNLLGRFGINLDKPITEIMSEATYNKISIMHKVTSSKQIGDDKVLVTYTPKLDYDIINSHNLDFLKVLTSYSDKETQGISNTSIVISAAVTAYARIHISKIKLDILSQGAQGGDIFYSDTDSIVTNIKLSDHMVNNNELGKLKLEHIIKKGIFITNKTYCLINDKDEYINKAKDVKSDSLNITHYEKLLKGEKVEAIKSQSKVNWNIGEVRI